LVFAAGSIYCAAEVKGVFGEFVDGFLDIVDALKITREHH